MLSVEPWLVQALEELQRNLKDVDDQVEDGGCCHDCASGQRYYDELQSLRDLIRDYPEARGLIWYTDCL